MSTTVQSRGFIAILAQPIDKEQIEETLEKLYDEGNGYLQITYDGRLVYSDEFRRKSYDEREFNGDLFVIGKLDSADKVAFIAETSGAGLTVDVNSVQPYTAIWYNGVDSPMSLLNLEDFQHQTLITSAVPT